MCPTFVVVFKPCELVERSRDLLCLGRFVEHAEAAILFVEADLMLGSIAASVSYRRIAHAM